jgi:hypothetical protein
LANNRHDRQAPSPGITARFRPRDIRDKIYPDLERFPDIWGLFGGRSTIRTGLIDRLRTAVIFLQGRLSTASSYRAASTPSRPTLLSWTAHRTHRPCSHIMWLFSRHQPSEAQHGSAGSSNHLSLESFSEVGRAQRRGCPQQPIATHWMAVGDRPSIVRRLSADINHGGASLGESTRLNPRLTSLHV